MSSICCYKYLIQISSLYNFSALNYNNKINEAKISCSVKFFAVFIGFYYVLFQLRTILKMTFQE